MERDWPRPRAVPARERLYFYACRYCCFAIVMMATITNAVLASLPLFYEDSSISFPPPSPPNAPPTPPTNGSSDAWSPYFYPFDLPFKLSAEDREAIRMMVKISGTQCVLLATLYAVYRLRAKLFPAAWLETIPRPRPAQSMHGARERKSKATGIRRRRTPPAETLPGGHGPVPRACADGHTSSAPEGAQTALDPDQSTPRSHEPAFEAAVATSPGAGRVTEVDQVQALAAVPDERATELSES